jgi:flagellar export protein FliJ
MNEQYKNNAAVWQTLLIKAEASSKVAQLRLIKANAARREALTQISKLDDLLLEYKQAHSQALKAASDTFLVSNYRQFVSQLEGIKAQASDSLNNFEAECENARQELRSVDVERQKMESLALKASKTQERLAEYRDTKVVETENLIRHNTSNL